MRRLIMMMLQDVRNDGPVVVNTANKSYFAPEFAREFTEVEFDTRNISRQVGTTSSTGQFISGWGMQYNLTSTKHYRWETK